MKGESQYDVLIVGFSMLGNIAALLLAEYGLRVVVVEKRQLSDLLVSKTARIDDEVMLMMQQLGLKEALTVGEARGDKFEQFFPTDFFHQKINWNPNSCLFFGFCNVAKTILDGNRLYRCG